MFMNYMDYTDDAAMFMFTAQQVLRMRTALRRRAPGCSTDEVGKTGSNDLLFATRWVHVFEEDTPNGAVYRPEPRHLAVAATAGAARVQERRGPLFNSP